MITIMLLRGHFGYKVKNDLKNRTKDVGRWKALISRHHGPQGTTLSSQPAKLFLFILGGIFFKTLLVQCLALPVEGTV